MNDDWILAVDQGTTNTKALLIDQEGRTVFRASAPLALLQPQPGYVEQDPVELWQSVRRTMAECARHAKSARASIAGIAISNQRETSIVWRRSTKGAGDPVSNAISWQCRRSTELCDCLSRHAGEIQQRSGLPLDPLLSASKWAWVFQQQPGLRAAAETGELRVGTVDAWLLNNLTRGALDATDHTNASRTGLLNLETLDWDEMLLSRFGIPRAALPALHPSGCEFAPCTAIAELDGVPILSVIGDSHAALLGHGCFRAGVVKATYGTGSSLMMLTPELVRQADRLARTVAWSTRSGARFALEGNIAMSGASVQWVGEFLGLPNPAQDAAALAETVPDSAGMVLVPAMVGLGAPYWDAAARGVIAGLERSHNAAHLARAALEAIAFQVADVLAAMEEASGAEIPLLLADGGATQNRSLMQFQTDILGRPVHSSLEQDLSARGAALLAGMELGWWKSLDEVAALPAAVEKFEPEMKPEKRENYRDCWRQAVRRARLRAGRKDGCPC